MFRPVSERVRLDAEALLNKDLAIDDYAGRLVYYVGNLAGNLHGHYG